MRVNLSNQVNTLYSNIEYPLLSFPYFNHSSLFRAALSTDLSKSLVRTSLPRATIRNNYNPFAIFAISLAYLFVIVHCRCACSETE